MQFDVVIGVLIGEKKIEAQLGYWDNCMTKEYVEEMGQAYMDTLSMILRS